MTHSAQTQITIIGSGLNGPCLALALAHQGFEITLLDAAPRALIGTEFSGRSYAVAHASTNLLKAIGLWQLVSEKAQPMQEIKASDGRAGEGPAPFFLHFERDALEEGPMGYMVEDRHLRPALLEMVEKHANITLRFETEVVSQNGGTLRLADKSTLTSQVVLACDGRNSPTAKRLNIARVGHDYGQTALVCALDHEKPHHGIAHQYFMPSGPLAILPLKGNRSSIVWSETPGNAASLMKANETDYLDVLKPRLGSYLGTFSLTGQRYSYPLNLTLAETYIAERTALVGDAAHGVHPIAGQGLNLGFRDIAALTEVLTYARNRGEDIGAPLVLERYQTWRRPDVTAMALGMDGINSLFSNTSPALRKLRTFGMGLIQKSPALRRGFMRQAAGLSGNAPKLLQGKPL